MRSGWKTTSQLLALLLAFALMQVYVMATPAAAASVAPASSAASGAEVFGRLSSVGYNKVIVNGNEVLSGTTILSGAQIQTPDSTAATVSLGSAGKLDIAPKSNLTLTFDRSGVVVNVVSGDALLTTNAGVKGLLTAPDGKIETADGQSVLSVGTALYQQDNKNPPGQDDDNDNNRKCRIAGIPCALFWVMVGGGAAVVTGFAATRGNNSSQSNPTS